MPAPPAPQPPIFNFNAYSPAEIEDAIETVGVAKAAMPAPPSFMPAMVAAGGIGLGALYDPIVASDADLGFAVTRLLGGLVFALGLVIVLVGGAELFTGNNLIVMALASGRISAPPASPFAPSRHERRPHRARRADHGGRKDSAPFAALVFKGVLCNLLVCLTVWLAAAGHSVTDKIAGLVLPISAFVAAAFEHSVANMYF